MVQISPVEAVALHVAQCACRQITLRMVFWFILTGLSAVLHTTRESVPPFLLFYCLGDRNNQMFISVTWCWLALRLWGTVDPSETTLYNPSKLRETLSQFDQGRIGGIIPCLRESRGGERRDRSTPHRNPVPTNAGGNASDGTAQMSSPMVSEPHHKAVSRAGYV